MGIGLKSSLARHFTLAAATLAVGSIGCGSGLGDTPESVSVSDLAPGGGSYSMRFEGAIPNCTVALYDSGGGCPADDTSCLCRPEFDAINTSSGSAGNPNGKVVLLSQPQWGQRADGTYAFDAYTAIKNQGNFVGHYVNALNPTMACAPGVWTGDGVGCSPASSSCGWRCITGTAWADQIVDAETNAYGAYPAPKWIALNEAWSLLFDNTTPGVYYRQWARDVVKELSLRNKWPLLYVQERHAAAGPYTLLGEIGTYAWLGVEAYLSGHEIGGAPSQCTAPFDSSNWCYQQYNTIREAVRNSASPAIPYDRLVMTEDFAANLYSGGANSFGRTYDNDTTSPTYGTPTTGSWNTYISRRAQAVKALPSLGGVSSFAWSGNTSGTGSSYRVQWGSTYSAITLP